MARHSLPRCFSCSQAALVTLPTSLEDLVYLLLVIAVPVHRGTDLRQRQVWQCFVANAPQIAPIKMRVTHDVMHARASARQRWLSSASFGVSYDRVRKRIQVFDY